MALSATEDEIRDRHSALYTKALSRWASDLRGQHQQIALKEIETEIDNVRAAWDRAVAQDAVAQLAHAIDGLCQFYDWRARYQEGTSACCDMVNRLGAKTTISPEASRTLGLGLVWQGIFSRKISCFAVVANGDTLRS